MFSHGSRSLPPPFWVAKSLANPPTPPLWGPGGFTAARDNQELFVPLGGRSAVRRCQRTSELSRAMLRTYAGPRGGEVIGFRWVFLGSGNSGNAGNLNGGFSNPLNTFRGFPVLTFFQENQSHEEEITEI